MRKVYIDLGHGGKDPGAIGPTKRTIEADIVRGVAHHLITILKDEEFEVSCPEPADNSLAWRVKMADQAGADIFLSLHCNSAVSPSAEGIETIYGAMKKKSHLLAICIQASMMERFPNHKNRGVKASPSVPYPRSLYLMRKQTRPAALVEMEFISHIWQEVFLRSNQWQIANALGTGIRIYSKMEHQTSAIAEVKNLFLIDKI